MRKPITGIQYLITILLLVCMQVTTFGQKHAPVKELNPDARLYSCFTKEYVDGLKNNPKLLAYYNFYLDHSYFIGDGGGAKDDAFVPDITTVKAREKGPHGEVVYFNEDVSQFSAKNFNPLKYDFQTRTDYYSQYRLGNTGKVVIFYSNNSFAKMYKEYLKSLNLE